MTQREEFEAWCELVGHSTTRDHKDNEFYWYAETSAAWDAWQAAQPAHQLPDAGNMVQPAQVAVALRDSTIDTITDACFQAVGYQGTTTLMRAVARAVERHHGIAAPSTKEGQQ